jgi:hypothetical protein
LDEAIDYARRITPAKLLVRIRKPVARRRLASVIQDLMYLAARLTRHAHRLGLSFWRNNPWHGVWEKLYQRFTGPAWCEHLVA